MHRTHVCFDQQPKMDHSSPMFNRRHERSLGRKIKELLWPSMGWRRAGHYLALRILRLSDADGHHDRMAQSIGCGIAMSFFPVFGVHAVLAAGVAFIIRANVVVAALATLIIPPVILPIIFSLDFIVGRHILNSLGYEAASTQEKFEQTAAVTSDWSWLVEHFEELFLPSFVGFLVFLPLVWSAGFIGTHKVMESLRRRYNRKHPELPL